MITQSGQNIPGTTYNDEMSSIQQLTLLPGSQPGYGERVQVNQTGIVSNPNIPMIFAGAIILLVLLHFLTEHEKSGMKPQHIRVGVHNWIVSGLLAMTFFVFAKVVVNKLNSTNQYVSAVRNFVTAA